MASEVIAIVLEKEREAQQELEDTKIKAEEMIFSGKKRARSIYDGVIKATAEEAFFISQNADEEINRLREENKKEYTKEIEAILALAEKKKDKAVEMVIERLFYQK